MAAEWIEDPVLRQRYRFERDTDPDGGEVLRVETRVDPTGGVTPHAHPAMEERFTVHSGRMNFLSGRKWVEAGPGETVVVPPGTRHNYRNDSEKPVHMTCEVRPPSTLQEFLTEAAELNRAGKLTRNAFPKRPSTILDVALLAERYREMVLFSFPPGPPPLIQRLVFPPLARLARRRGR
jgi:quercetin dioxygenase-like cupin family protein